MEIESGFFNNVPENISNLGNNITSNISGTFSKLPSFGNLVGPSTPSNSSSAGAASLNTKSSIEQKIPSSITQTERLFTTRSRAINHVTERGQHTYIKILTANPEESLTRHFKEITSKTTSLGSSSSGVLSDAINEAGKGYASFLLTDIQGNFDEKIQITEVFGDAEVVYYFGRHPLTFELSGLLIDSPDNDWFTQWVEMYAHALRGSQLARNYELVKIVTPNLTLVGTISRMSFSQNSQRDADVPFRFSFLAKEIIPNPIVSPNRPLAPSDSIDFSKSESFVTQAGITSKKSLIDGIVGTIQNPFSTVKDYATAMTPNLGTGFSMAGFDPGIPFFAGNKSTGGANGTSTSGSASLPNSGALDAFTNVSSNLSGIRASLFSPVYGVLSSLTKLIKGTTGSVSSVIDSFTSPVKDILRDVKNISNQALGVVNLVNTSVGSITNIARGVDLDLRSTLASLKKTAGVISNAPQSLTSSLRDLVNSGKLPATSGFLLDVAGSTLSRSNGQTSSKIALLNSGPKHTPQLGARL